MAQNTLHKNNFWLRESWIFLALRAVGLCSSDSLCCCLAHTATDDAETSGHGCVPTTLFMKTGGWLDVVCGPQFADPCFRSNGQQQVPLLSLCLLVL